MKTILVPTDYSEAANNALYYAIELAKLAKAKIVLLHAYQVPLPTGEVPVMLITPADLEKENVMRIKKLEKDIEKKFSDEVKVEHVVRAGFVSEEILSAIKDKNIDLVVMGIAGESRLTRALMGSNTVSVIRKTKTPVLVIPRECKYAKIEKIAFACDYQNSISEEVMKQLKQFVKLFKAKLLVLDVVKPETMPVYENAVAGVTLAHSLGDVDHSLYFPEGEDITSEINSFVDTYKADWLVMMPHRHSFFEGLFHKSNVRQMAFHTHVPLLSLHE